MDTFVKLVVRNPLGTSLASAAIIGLVGLVWRALRDRRDSRLIISFLGNSRDHTEYTFRSTEAISAHTNLREDRVAKLCARHTRIRRNEKEKQSWRLG